MDQIHKVDTSPRLDNSTNNNDVAIPKFMKNGLVSEFNKQIERANQQQLVHGIAYSWGSAIHTNTLGIQQLKELALADISDSHEAANQFDQWIRTSLPKNLHTVDRLAYEEAISNAKKAGEDVKMAVLAWVDQYISKYHH